MLVRQSSTCRPETTATSRAAAIARRSRPTPDHLDVDTVSIQHSGGVWAAGDTIRVVKATLNDIHGTAVGAQGRTAEVGYRVLEVSRLSVHGANGGVSGNGDGLSRATITQSGFHDLQENALDPGADATVIDQDTLTNIRGVGIQSYSHAELHVTNSLIREWTFRRFRRVV